MPMCWSLYKATHARTHTFLHSVHQRQQTYTDVWIMRYWESIGCLVRVIWQLFLFTHFDWINLTVVFLHELCILVFVLFYLLQSQATMHTLWSKNAVGGGVGGVRGLFTWKNVDRSQQPLLDVWSTLTDFFVDRHWLLVQYYLYQICWRNF